MIESKKFLIAAFMFPIVALLLLAGYKAIIRSSGFEYVFSVEGYDPRDVLSGHYLAFRVNYGVSNLCNGSVLGDRDAYVCISDRTFSYSFPSRCERLLRGRCHATTFEAGIEKFFVPEAEASRLEHLIREKKASVVVTVARNGQAQLKDLLIEGKPWKDIPKDTR